MSGLESSYKNQLDFGSVVLNKDLTAEIVAISSCFGEVAKTKPNSIFTNRDNENVVDCVVQRLRNKAR
jgi:hypothetical protein